MLLRRFIIFPIRNGLCIMQRGVIIHHSKCGYAMIYGNLSAAEKGYTFTVSLEESQMQSHSLSFSSAWDFLGVYRNPKNSLNMLIQNVFSEEIYEIREYVFCVTFQVLWRLVISTCVKANTSTTATASANPAFSGVSSQSGILWSRKCILQNSVDEPT